MKWLAGLINVIHLELFKVFMRFWTFSWLFLRKINSTKAFQSNIQGTDLAFFIFIISEVFLTRHCFLPEGNSSSRLIYFSFPLISYSCFFRCEWLQWWLNDIFHLTEKTRPRHSFSFHCQTFLFLKCFAFPHLFFFPEWMKNAQNMQNMNKFG